MIHADVLVVGGGLTGCSMAYFLAGEGVDVVLIERIDIGSQASGANAGSLHCQIPNNEFLEKGEDWARSFAPSLRLMRESIGMWRELGKELDADLEFSQQGGLLVAETDRQMRDIERKAGIERANGIEIEILSRDDLRKIAPYISDSIVGGSYCPHEGKANPLNATPAFARAARSRGARIFTRTALHGIEKTEQGFCAKTSIDDIGARRVVNSAGADAGRVAAMVGLDIDIEGYPIQVNVTERSAPLIKHLLYFAGNRLTLKQAGNGGFLIGGGWRSSINPKTGLPMINPDSIRGNMHAAVSVVPALRDLRLLRIWPAIVNGTNDWRPVLGEVPGMRGFFMNMFPWMGFTAGPLSARIVADMVLGRKPVMDVSGISTLH